MEGGEANGSEGGDVGWGSGLDGEGHFWDSKVETLRGLFLFLPF